jgi:hypothetical protein
MTALIKIITDFINSIYSSSLIILYDRGLVGHFHTHIQIFVSVYLAISLFAGCHLRLIKESINSFEFRGTFLVSG